MDLTNGPIRKQLIFFSLPLILTLVLQQSYSLMDTMIVAHYCNMESVSAISTTSSIYSFLIALIIGLGVGCSIMTGQAFGKKNDQYLSDVILTLLIGGSTFAILLSLICLIFARQLLIFIHTPSEILDLSTIILRLYAGGVIFYGISMIGSNLVNAMGESKKTFYIFSTSGAINIILDLVAVLWFNMGVIGTVIASMIAQIYSLVLILWLLKKKMPHPVRPHFQFSIIQDTLSLSMTSMGQNALSNGLAVVVQTVVNGFGIAYINGFSAGLLINSIFTIAVRGYCNGYATMLSQNFGAKQWDRIQEARKISKCDGNLLCLSLAMFSCLLAKPLTILMLSDASSVSIHFGTQYILMCIPTYFFVLHTQRFSFLLKNLAHNKETFVSTILTILIKIVTLYPLVMISIELLALTEIISQALALIYLFYCQHKVVHNHSFETKKYSTNFS